MDLSNLTIDQVLAQLKARLNHGDPQSSYLIEIAKIQLLDRIARSLESFLDEAGQLGQLGHLLSECVTTADARQDPALRVRVTERGSP